MFFANIAVEIAYVSKVCCFENMFGGLAFRDTIVEEEEFSGPTIEPVDDTLWEAQDDDVKERFKSEE
jgi:hypothetical protein